MGNSKVTAQSPEINIRQHSVISALKAEKGIVLVFTAFTVFRCKYVSVYIHKF